MQEAKQEIKQYNVQAISVEKRKSAPLLSKPISALTGCSFWHCPPDKSKPDIWPVWYLPFVCKSSANSGLHLWTVHAYRSSNVFRALSECRFASHLCVFGGDLKKLSVSGKSGYIVNSALALLIMRHFVNSCFYWTTINCFSRANTPTYDGWWRGPEPRCTVANGKMYSCCPKWKLLLNFSRQIWFVVTCNQNDEQTTKQLETDLTLGHQSTANWSNNTQNHREYKEI